jgi:pimeloyl-ACP methyl ester carboxylesterase
MQQRYEDAFTTINGLRLHYLTFSGNGPVLLLLHGLSANAHAFDGLIAAGLDKIATIITVDLRGRGQSDKPDTGYSMAEQAQDIVAILDQLQIPEVVLGGHSYGAFLTFYIAANYPDRVSRMILMDGAAQLHENAQAMLMPTISRLGQTYPSFEDYISHIREAAYTTYWDDYMLDYYRADVITHPDGSVTPLSHPSHITEAGLKLLEVPWLELIPKTSQPALLFNALQPYTMDVPLLPAANAQMAAHLIHNCRYVPIDGNHQNMLYGAGAKQIVQELIVFLQAA